MKSAKPAELQASHVLIVSLILIIVASASIIMYYNNKLDLIVEEQNTKLILLNKNIIENLQQLNNEINQNLAAMESNLSLSIETVNRGLTIYKNQNDQDIIALGQLIDEIERQSNVQLDDLKTELLSIKVESSDFSAIIDDVLQSVVSVGTNIGQGSGAAINDEGFIVTNYHVVEGASLIRIMTYGGKVYDAQLIGYDEDVDIAVLKSDADLDPLFFGDSDNVKIGERVIALGNPAGLSFSVTEGIVSAVGRTGPNNQNIYLQTDVPINPGNSGGPLVNSKKKIIGINNFKIGGFESLGFAIESNTAESAVEEIIDLYNGQQ